MLAEERFISSGRLSQTEPQRLFVLRAALYVGLLTFLTTVATAQEKTFEDGRRAYDYGEFTAARTIWLTLATHGDARSQTSLGYLLREGKGLPRNSKIAAAWYQKAALQGEPTAQSALCEMYSRGEGVPRDLEAALLWCELSIEAGESGSLRFRDQALYRLPADRRDYVWKMIADWHNHPHDNGSVGIQPESTSDLAKVLGKPSQ
jgi:TPR repeat protein